MMIAVQFGQQVEILYVGRKRYNFHISPLFVQSVRRIYLCGKLTKIKENITTYKQTVSQYAASYSILAFLFRYERIYIKMGD